MPDQKFGDFAALAIKVQIWERFLRVLLGSSRGHPSRGPHDLYQAVPALQGSLHFGSPLASILPSFPLQVGHSI